MGSIYQQHEKAALRFQKKLGKGLWILLPVVGLCWLIDIYLEWQYILAIITSAVYVFLVFVYVILRLINR